MPKDKFMRQHKIDWVPVQPKREQEYNVNDNPTFNAKQVKLWQPKLPLLPLLPLTLLARLGRSLDSLCLEQSVLSYLIHSLELST